MDGRCKAYSYKHSSYVARLPPDCDVTGQTTSRKELRRHVLPELLRAQDSKGTQVWGMWAWLGEEVKMSLELLRSMSVRGQSVRFLRTDAQTKFNIDTLTRSSNLKTRFLMRSLKGHTNSLG